MEKKNKLNLNSIEVTSFVTTINDQEKETIQGAAKGSWWISGCFLSLACGATTVIQDQSGTWTLADNILAICKNNSREQWTALNQCPDCVKIDAAPVVNEN